MGALKNFTELMPDQTQQIQFSDLHNHEAREAAPGPLWWLLGML